MWAAINTVRTSSRAGRCARRASSICSLQLEVVADRSVELQVLSLALPAFSLGRESTTGEHLRLAGFPDEQDRPRVWRDLVRERHGGRARGNREVIVEGTGKEPAGDWVAAYGNFIGLRKMDTHVEYRMDPRIRCNPMQT